VSGVAEDTEDIEDLNGVVDLAELEVDVLEMDRCELPEFFREIFDLIDPKKLLLGVILAS
jgi:hypothetical protein